MKCSSLTLYINPCKNKDVSKMRIVTVKIIIIVQNIHYTFCLVIKVIAVNAV